jgi:hypothetical protein
MASVSEHLKRWRDAGVLEPEAAARIEAYEREQRSGRKEDERPGALEALLYLGVVVLGVGVFALVAQQWDELESWARVMATAVPVLILLGAGLAMRLSNEPSLERGGQVAWLVAVALFAGALAVIVNEYGPDSRSGDDDRDALHLIASGTVALALVLWVFSAAHAQVVALAGSLAFLAQSIGGWPDQFSEPLAGFLLLVFGVAGLVLGELKWLTPRASTRFAFAVMTVAGPYQAGFSGDSEIVYELLTFVAAAGVLALGVWRGSFSLVVVGILGMFVALVTFIFEHFEDEIGAPVALMLSGGALVGAVLAIAAFRAESQRRRNAR